MRTYSSQLNVFLRAGAFAGVLTTLIFTIVHHIFIINIWDSFFVMAVAGLISGVSIASSFGLLFSEPTLRNWWIYNLMLLVMFVLLGVFSVLTFEPVTTITEIMDINSRPVDLIYAAMPITAVFTIGFAFLLSLLYARTAMQYIAVFSTCVILMMILGLNVSILGLVYFPKGSFYLITEIFGLILVIMGFYALLFVVFGRKVFVR